MDNNEQIYEKYNDTIEEMFDAEPFYQDFMNKLKGNKNSFYIYSKKISKDIDLSWVEAIEDSIIAIDNAIRNPRKYMETREELLPMELSRNITPDSIKHLSQHTYLINDIAEDGTITPNKIMNYIKEETWQTYENKFVNTLIDRLYYFIENRYRKICDTANDENVGVVQFDSKLPDNNGGYVSMKMILEAHQKQQSSEDEKDDIVERVEKLRNIIMNFKSSQFVKTMGESYVKPPIMRTNAILKNPDYKQCLICWQFIESYTKVGYEIKIEEATKQPTDEFVDDIYRISAMNYGVFKHYMEEQLDQAIVLKERRNKKKIAPKFVKKMMDSVFTNYDIAQHDFRNLVNSALKINNSEETEAETTRIVNAIDRVLKIEEDTYINEKKAIEQRRKEIIEEKQRQLAEEERKKQQEEEEERQRIQREKEEQERRERAAKEEEERKIREAKEEEERKKKAALIEMQRIKREAEEKRQKEIQDRRDAANSVAVFVEQRRRY